jgi:integrase
VRGRFKVTPCVHGRNKYIVTGYTNGRRIRTFFRTKLEAETFAEGRNIELQNFGHELSVMPSALRSEALTCSERLAPFGVTITQVTDIWLGHNDWRAKSVLVKEGIEKFFVELDRKLAANEIGNRHHKTLRSVIKKLQPAFTFSYICDLSPEILNKWLVTQPVIATTRNNIQRNLSVFFTYAVDNVWIAENPLRKVKRANTKRLRAAKKVCIYTPEQAAAILVEADHDLVPFFAIGLFAGLRTSEIERLDWRHILWDERLIDVEGENSKTGKARFVPMSDNLVAWLSPYQGMQGPVAEATQIWKRIQPGRRGRLNLDRRKLVRDRAGIPATGMANAMRHSYCSYRYALHNDLGECAKHAGNSPAVFLSNYNHRVKEAPARQYFSIMPQDAQNIIKVA